MKNMHQRNGLALADAARSLSGPAQAIKDDADRRDLAAAHAGMCAEHRRAKLGTRAGRLNEVARQESRWHPMWDLVLDARAAAAAGEPEEKVCAPFRRMLDLVVAACRTANPLPSAVALELRETREQGDADVAVRTYLAEPDDSPRKALLAADAAREIVEHMAALGRLHDRIREDGVTLPFPSRPSLVRSDVRDRTTLRDALEPRGA